MKTALLAFVVLGACSVLVGALAGCAGGDKEKVAYTGADARRLAQIGPVTPGWPAWPASTRSRKATIQGVAGGWRSRATRSSPNTTVGEPRRLTGANLDAGDAGNRWEDENKLANLTVGTFENAADAHVAFDAGNELALGYGKIYGVVTKVGEKSRGSATRAGSCGRRATGHR